MKVDAVNGSKYPFGYSNELKTLWKAGRLPTVKYGFYGGELTKKNVTLDHVLARSKGGKSTLANYVLATRDNNGKKASMDVAEHFDPFNAFRYFSQFLGVKCKGFDGTKYVKMLMGTLEDLGIDLSKY